MLNLQWQELFLLALKLPVGIIYELLTIEWNSHLNRKAAIMGTDLLGGEEEGGPFIFSFTNTAFNACL